MLKTKYIRSIKKYHVHDPLERTSVGDKILFEKSRPFSKTKHWIFKAWFLSFYSFQSKGASYQKRFFFKKKKGSKVSFSRILGKQSRVQVRNGKGR